MIYRIPSLIEEACSLCSAPAFDAFMTNAGNNAEVMVVVRLCPFHLKEMEKDGRGFDKKYAKVYEQLANEREVVS